MEKSRNFSQIISNNLDESKIKMNSHININDVKSFAEKLHKDKQKFLNSSLQETKVLSNELDNIKLQNEELELTIQNLRKDNENLENSYELLNKSFTILSTKYNETRELLNTSHKQNLLLSDIVNKLRKNENCLIEESQKLRRVGSTRAFNDLQLNNIKSDNISQLEQQIKFWQQEAEKLYQIIELQDKASTKLIDSKVLGSKSNKKKSPNIMKRYNKVVVRSHSLENNQRKLKESEFMKLKLEKENMQSLLNNLEFQISEKKEKLDKTETVLSDVEKKLDEKIKENEKYISENEKYSENINLLIKDNKYYQLYNQKILKEINDTKAQFCIETKNAEMQIKNLVEENHDLGVRSVNLKDKVQAIELDFLSLERELVDKNQQIQEQDCLIKNFENQLEKNQSKFIENHEKLNHMDKDLNESFEKIADLKKMVETLENKLAMKVKENDKSKLQIKEKDDEIIKTKTSMAAQKIKFENHLQNADQIISSKVKLISSLELKLANSDQEINTKDEEILNLKKHLNSKNHDYDILFHKYEEVQDSKKYLQQHIDNVSVANTDNGREIIALHQSLAELKAIISNLKEEIVSLKQLLEDKDRLICQMENNRKELEIKIDSKSDEINKNKKVLTQLCNEIEQKDAHVESLLDIIREKDDKISHINLIVENNEETIKEYADQLNNVDQSVIQSTARTNALEKEIETLRNANMRLSRQKEQLNCSLSARNKEVGHLQARLDNLESRKHSRKFKAFPQPIEKDCFHQESVIRKDKENTKEIILDTDFECENRESRRFIPINARSSNIIQNNIADNYDPIALKNRSYSYDGREMCSIDCV